MATIEKLRFLNKDQISRIADRYGTPVFAYDERLLIERAREAKDFEAPFGLTVRYAMKANPNAALVRLFDGQGLHIDASSGFEVERALQLGIPAGHIMLTSQELPGNLTELVGHGALFNATSLHQLEVYGQTFPGSEVSVRINPGLGSGGTNRTNTGGPASSFGIWHEYIDQAQSLAKRYRLKITKIHTHIGSGSDPAVWQKVVGMGLAIVDQFPDVTVLNLGGGYKVARMSDETAIDLPAVSRSVAKTLRAFAERTGRKLHLEIEPGSYLVANAGALIARIQDIVDTGPSGYRFLKLDTGMTELMRPSLYGSQHPIVVIGSQPGRKEQYVVVGHCCESGDLLTPQPANPEMLATRLLEAAKIDDLVVIEGVGAYGSAMSAQGYNSFPAAAAVLVASDDNLRLIRRRQTLAELTATEVQLI
ncbi:MAG TPA: diaminopimelate decarboxylase [Candidatus Saccharimonadales bacterium]|nr:diaminopimelate decarboxylase [Candidatus Saccharimonadales bacterium]